LGNNSDSFNNKEWTHFGKNDPNKKMPIFYELVQLGSKDKSHGIFLFP